MSIWGSWLSIENLDQVKDDLAKNGISFGAIGGTTPDDYDAPIIYQGSHILPENDNPRGGSVGVAAVGAHVRFWRDNPDAPILDEPESGVEPFLRLSVDTHDDTNSVGKQHATVILTERQVTRLRDTLTEWLHAREEKP